MARRRGSGAVRDRQHRDVAPPVAAATVDERGLASRLRRVNLDLLPILYELLHTRSVTRTARSFGMTQPAVSRALRQLRAAFEDQTLVGYRGNIDDSRLFRRLFINADGNSGLFRVASTERRRAHTARARGCVRCSRPVLCCARFCGGRAVVGRADRLQPPDLCRGRGFSVIRGSARQVHVGRKIGRAHV